MNKGNDNGCVLDDLELELIDTAFKDYLSLCSEAGKSYLMSEVTRIKLKITKLNDIVNKQTKE